MNEDELSITFGELEGRLGTMHAIAQTKRTAFSSRLKNFHRLKFPFGFETKKGRAARYSPGHIAEMALIVELTQLGLPPERAVRVLALNWYPAAMAISMAARTLAEHPVGFDPNETRENDPTSIFIFFDPAALEPLAYDYDPALTPDLDQASDTFFYGGQGVVREELVRWTSGSVSRISLVNVTNMVDTIATSPPWGDPLRETAFRKRFFESLAHWASERSEGKFVAEEGEADFIFKFVSAYFRPPSDEAGQKELELLMESYFAFSEEAIRKGIGDFVRERGGASASNPQA